NPAKVWPPILKRRVAPAASSPAPIGVPPRSTPIGPPTSEPRVSTTRTGVMKRGVPPVEVAPGADEPATSSRAWGWVEGEKGMGPARAAGVGRAVAQKLWAIGAEGLTVEAFGRCASWTSPGKTVTKPPEAAG